MIHPSASEPNYGDNYRTNETAKTQCRKEPREVSQILQRCRFPGVAVVHNFTGVCCPEYARSADSQDNRGSPEPNGYALHEIFSGGLQVGCLS
jgi:hypothetical protein